MLGRFGRRPEFTKALYELCQEILRLEPSERQRALLSLSSKTRSAIRALDYEWDLFAFKEQTAPPEPWRWWVMCGGRGGGKTRSAAEPVLDWAYENPGIRMALVGKDAGSVRRVMINGNSGILARSPEWFKPRWWKSDKKLEWKNGTIAELHSSEEPGTLRGPQYHKAWITELFHWNIAKNETEPTAWREGVKLTLRLGDNPQGIIDSSPRGTEFCANFLLGPKQATGGRKINPEDRAAGEWRIEHDVVDHEGKAHQYTTVCRRWSSEKNAAHLSPGIVAEWRHELRGSRLEAQELDGEILERTDGALFSLENIDAYRVKLGDLFRVVPGAPRFKFERTLVAVDPTRSDSPTDEAGIIIGHLGSDGHAYIRDDRSLRASPDQWAREALKARGEYGAEALVREKNRLGKTLMDLIQTIDTKAKWIDVNASEGKRTRAEPVAALYEQGKVHHIAPIEGAENKLARVEDEMISWDARTNAPSPNRMDALVWLVTALLIGLKPPSGAAPRGVGTNPRAGGVYGR